jgi:26S proteasome regulatory subunit N12
MALQQAQGQLTEFKAALDANQLDKCEKTLASLKLVVFASLGTSKDERALARDMLELACVFSIKKKDVLLFERHVAQLKMYYMDHQDLGESAQKYPILGLYLLHLLASDRIGDFHTELELIEIAQHDNTYIKTPVQLERHIMEGNYAKILDASKDVPHENYKFFMEKLMETVRSKVGASLERSYENLPVSEASRMLFLSGVAQLQEFIVKETERKAREGAMDQGIGDMTPSLTRRNMQPVNIQWEVKGDKLYFTRSAQKQLEVPIDEIMDNTIGYATDLERIV